MSNLKETLGHDNKEYISAIEKALNSKYSLDFTVESIGGAYGTHNNDTIKAWCYCNDGKYANIKFYAEIDKVDLGKVNDSYLSVVAASMISDNIATKVDAKPITVVESSSYLETNEINDLGNYLNNLNSYFVTTHIFIKDSQLASSQEYANQVMDVAEKVKSLNLQDFCITVWFVTEFSDDIEQTYKETKLDKLYDEYLSKEYTSKCATVQIYGTEIKTDFESVISSLERK